MKDSENPDGPPTEDELERQRKTDFRDAFADLDTQAVDEAASRLLLDAVSGTLPDQHPLRAAGESSEIVYGRRDTTQVADHLAAAAFGHQIDAWSYFGAATSAMHAGESAIARHLLYYSELRSAFAILARHGVLIRSSKHLALSVHGVRVSNKVGTHEAVWDAFKRWSRTAGATSLFLDAPQLSGVPLSAWLAEGGLVPTETIQELLRDVGYDLSRFEEDRVARNSASYGPRWVRSIDAETLLAFHDLPDLWRLVRPYSNSGFDDFDAEFVSIVVARARTRAKASLKEKVYPEWARRTAERLGASQPETAARTLFAFSKPSGRTASLRHAFDPNPPPDDLSRTRAMIGRAFVLARFASGAVSDMVRNAAITDEELEPWLRLLGGRSGLWDISAQGITREEALEPILEAGEIIRAAPGDALVSLRSDYVDELELVGRFPILATWIVDDFERPLPAV